MLIDTNIFIEIARNQEGAEECRDLLDAINQGLIPEDIYLTRFSLSAIEALIGHFDKEFLRKILMMIYQEDIKIYKPDIKDDIMTLSAMKDTKLDFDDTTQFLATNKLKTYLVTFDKDFKKVPIQTKTPSSILKKILE